MYGDGADQNPMILQGVLQFVTPAYIPTSARMWYVDSLQ